MTKHGKDVEKVIRVLGLHTQSGWVLTLDGVMETIAKEARMTRATLVKVYETLSKPPYEYVKKRYQYWDNQDWETDQSPELNDVSPEEYQQFQDDGVACDHWGHEMPLERIFVSYMVTDKLPRDTGVLLIENAVDALYKFRDKELGKVEIRFILSEFIDFLDGK